MKEVFSCPGCKCDRHEEIFRSILEYPVGSLADKILDFNFVRNYIFFEKILQQKGHVEFKYKICTTCGLIFFSPRCEEKDYEIKFNTINELASDILNEDFTYSKSYDDEKAFSIYNRLSRYRKIENATIIDVGGARGLYLKHFLPQNKCYVVDYVKHDLVPGAEYLGRSSFDIPEYVRADIVLFCHTLEHVIDPIKDVENIIKILKPNGLLYIEVPPGCWQQEYKNMRNFITHINFFSEGSLWHLLDMCGLHIRNLKLQPLIGRTRYEPIIMAIAEKSSHKNRRIDALHVTRQQMKGHHLLLRVYTNYRSFRLMKFQYFYWLLKRIRLLMFGYS